MRTHENYHYVRYEPDPLEPAYGIRSLAPPRETFTAVAWIRDDFFRSIES
jgi:hypothetical protein